MHVLGALIVGLFIGLLGRLLVRGKTRIGFLLTLLIGVVGAAIGQKVGDHYDFSGLATFAIEVLIAAVLVALLGSMLRGRNRRW